MLSRRKYLRALGALTSGGLLSSCDNSDGNTADGAPVDAPGTGNPEGVPGLAQTGRTVGIASTKSESQDFGPNVLDRLISSGAHSTSLSVYWDDIEPSHGVYAPNPNYLDIADLFYPSAGLAINIGFSVLDTTNKRLAPHLAGLSLDDSRVIADFNAMLDWAATQLPNSILKSVHIGNEVDIYLTANPDEWDAWITFFRQTSSHARTLWPNTPIGCKTTYNGMMGAQRAKTLELHQLADATLVTYYLINEEFRVLPPSTVATVFANLKAYPVSAPILILEHGSPSSPLIGSSESQQAEFITETFLAWDTFAASIVHVEFFAMHDFNPAIVEVLQDYYSLPDPLFGAYLSSLGLRTWPGDGSDKQAWPRLLEEISIRN